MTYAASGRCVSYRAWQIEAVVLSTFADGGSRAESALARKVVERFVAAWPAMKTALLLPCPGAAELREAAARCCTLAMRADRSALCWRAPVMRQRP